MKLVTAVRTVLMLVAPITLAACQEDERACYERINADFERTAEMASKSGHHDRAVTALESSVSALVIYHDDDRSICDYVTADVYLQRK